MVFPNYLVGNTQKLVGHTLLLLPLSASPPPLLLPPSFSSSLPRKCCMCRDEEALLPPMEKINGGFAYFAHWRCRKATERHYDKWILATSRLSALVEAPEPHKEVRRETKNGGREHLNVLFHTAEHGRERCQDGNKNRRSDHFIAWCLQTRGRSFTCTSGTWVGESRGESNWRVRGICLRHGAKLQIRRLFFPRAV